MDNPREGRGRVKVCQQCGKGFEARVRADRPSRFCSKECMWRAQVKRPFATCRQCGKGFLVGRDSKGMYCSRECQWASMRVSRESERGYYEAVRWMESLSRMMARGDRTLIAVGCRQCGKGFLTVSKEARFCSDRCRRRHANRLKDRRVYRNGMPDGSITLDRLFVRDGGRCRRCGLLMTFGSDPNSDEYPSVDHIIPLSRGGLHRWDNVQLMCRGCNSNKKAMLLPARPASEAAWFRGWRATETLYIPPTLAGHEAWE